MQETLVRFLGGEDPLEDSMATHSSILAWRVPMDRGVWRAKVHGVAETWTQLSTHCISLSGFPPREMWRKGQSWTQTVAVCGRTESTEDESTQKVSFPRVAVAKALLLLLSRFRHVRLCVTPQTAAHQAPRPWDSPGKNTGGALVHTKIFLLLLNLEKDFSHPHFHRTCRQRPGRLT